MLACSNSECSRRFCEHCLLTHLNEDVDPTTSTSWITVSETTSRTQSHRSRTHAHARKHTYAHCPLTHERASARARARTHTHTHTHTFMHNHVQVGGKKQWQCPICRKVCCCSVTTCNANHRHCKAYRYRRRRAELASKRLSNGSNTGLAEPATHDSLMQAPDAAVPVMAAGGQVQAMDTAKRARKALSSTTSPRGKAGMQSGLGEKPLRSGDPHAAAAAGSSVSGVSVGLGGNLAAQAHKARRFGRKSGAMDLELALYETDDAEVTEMLQQHGLTADEMDFLTNGGSGMRCSPSLSFAAVPPTAFNSQRGSGLSLGPARGNKAAARANRQASALRKSFDEVPGQGESGDSSSIRREFTNEHSRLLPGAEAAQYGEEEGVGELMADLMAPAHILFGHMEQCCDIKDLDRADLLFNQYAGVGAADEALASGANPGTCDDGDEALWLKKTYETVYNPQSRKRALDHLCSVHAKGTSPQPAGGTPTAPLGTTASYIASPGISPRVVPMPSPADPAAEGVGASVGTSKLAECQSSRNSSNATPTPAAIMSAPKMTPPMGKTPTRAHLPLAKRAGPSNVSGADAHLHGVAALGAPRTIAQGSPAVPWQVSTDCGEVSAQRAADALAMPPPRCTVMYEMV